LCTTCVELLRIAEHRRQVGGRFEPDALASVLVEREHVCHQAIEIDHLKGKGAAERAIVTLNSSTIDFIALTCVRMIVDCARSSAWASAPTGDRQTSPAIVRWQAVWRRQRILDLVRQALCNLAPGRSPLRLDERGGVVEHHQVIGSVAAARE
jgi:hypothetical protein